MSHIANRPQAQALKGVGLKKEWSLKSQVVVSCTLNQLKAVCGNGAKAKCCSASLLTPLNRIEHRKRKHKKDEMMRKKRKRRKKRRRATAAAGSKRQTAAFCAPTSVVRPLSAYTALFEKDRSSKSSGNVRSNNVSYGRSLCQQKQRQWGEQQPEAQPTLMRCCKWSLELKCFCTPSNWYFYGAGDTLNTGSTDYLKSMPMVKGCSKKRNFFALPLLTHTGRRLQTAFFILRQ